MTFRPALMRIFLHAVSCLLLLAGLTACSQPQVLRLSGSTMGTTYNITIADPVADSALLKTAIDQRLLEVNQVMSTYIADSELSLLNRHEGEASVAISEEMAAVLADAFTVYEMSQGALDVTVGPLVNLWGFGPDPRDAEVPTETEIKQAMARTGFHKFKLEGRQLSLAAGAYVDLSTIAKGYGVDQVAKLLQSQGLNNFLVEIGGELSAQGLNPKGKIWRIAVEKPEILSRDIFKVLPLQNRAMATSGDYRNYFEKDGRRYSHIIDPSSGYPIKHKVVSATVLAKSCAMADALATAVNVMGEEKGLAMAEAHNLAVMVIIKTAQGFEARYSSAFESYLTQYE